MHPWIRITLLDIRLLAKSKVFYFKLILLPVALIFILGTVFGSPSERSLVPGKGHMENDQISSAGVNIPIVWLASPNREVNSMQYEAVAMTVLFSLLTAFELTHSLVRDKINYTLSRIRSTPVSMLQYVLGKLLGITLAIIIQMLIVIISSQLLFDVHWGNIPALLGVTFLYGLAIGSLVLCCGFWANNHASISSFAAPVLYGLGFLGGSFFNKDSFPPLLKEIQEWTPNGSAINAYVHIIQGADLSTLSRDMLELTGLAAVFLIMALLLAGRKVK